MEEAEEDDMACGDLGNGLGRRPGANRVEESDAAALPGSKQNSFYSGSSKKPVTSSTRQHSCESNTEVPNEELKQQLQEALEEVDILKVELEASRRQLEGKDEALRILQSMVGVLQKSFMVKGEEQKKSSYRSISNPHEPVFPRTSV